MTEYIKRVDAESAVWEILNGLGYSQKHNDRLVEEVDAVIDEVVAADVREVKHGKWIWDDEGYHCSECFYHAYGETGEVLSGHWLFCPNCGARLCDEEPM